MSYAVKAEEVAYVEKVNNLEAPDEEPNWWTPSRVQRHLLEAFKIDDRMPKVASPKQPGSAHPAMEYTREEIEAWETVPLDPRRFPVTREQERAMNVALDWLFIVRAENMDAYRALRAFMLIERRRGGEGCQTIKRYCRDIGVLRVTFLYRKDRALSLIASKLNADLLPVF